MGYDVHFQLVDPLRIYGLLTHLQEGKAPPPSAFDERPDAEALWAKARAQILGDDPALAARVAGQLVVIWSAASLPFVWTRNFAVTYAPIRMEEELTAVPSSDFGSPELLFQALRGLSWTGRLEGSGSVGGYVYRVDRAAGAIKEFHDQLPPELRRRVLPLLQVLRAAQRHDLCVLESADLLGVTSVRTDMLCWPGLARFGLEGEPLTSAEWHHFGAAGPSFGDLEDATDRIVATDVCDRETRSAILALLHGVSWRSGYADPFLPRLLGWLERAFAAGEHEGTWQTYFRLCQAFHNRVPPRPLEPAWGIAALERSGDPALVCEMIHLFGPRSPQAPTPELATALLQAYCRAPFRFDDYVPSYYVRHLVKHGAPPEALASLHDLPLLGELVSELDKLSSVPLLEMLERALTYAEPSEEIGEQLRQWFYLAQRRAGPAELSERLARAWLELFARMAEHALPFPHLDTPTVAQLIVDELLRRPPSVLLLRAVSEVLSSAPGWEDGEAAWIAALLDRHRAALCALVELGLETGEAELRQAARVLTSPNDLREIRWVRGLADALESGDGVYEISAWAYRVPLVPETAPTLARACLCLFRDGRDDSDRLVALLAHGIDLAEEAMRACISGDPQSSGRVAMRLSSRLICTGHARQAVIVTEVALEHVREGSKPNVLYNQACAHARLGEAVAAADSLRRAIELDPSQRDDAARDPDFEGIRSHPALAALLG
jgi:hypothetical protein